MSEEREAPAPEVGAALRQLDDLIQMFSEHPDESVQEAVVGMLRAVDVLHRGALERLGAFLDARALLDEALADPHVALVFDLYRPQEHEDDELARANAAVEGIRPYVEAHGGRLEVVTAEGGVVNIRLMAGCENCSGSTATLHSLVEEALRAALPGFVRMDLSPPPRQRASSDDRSRVLIPVSSVTRQDRHSPPGGACGTGGHGCSSCR